MPIQITVDRTTLSNVDVLLHGVRDGSKRASRAAVKRTATTAKTRIGRLVAAELNVKAGDAKKQVFPIRADEGRNIAGIRVSGRLLSLRLFNPVQLKRKGVVATTFRSKGRQSFGAAFISGEKQARARMSRAGRIISAGRVLPPGVVFSRQAQKANAQYGPVAGRLPIHKLYGPSAADAVLARQNEFESEINGLGAVLESNLLSQVDRLLSRSKSER